ncbi:MAG: septum formation initiator family protein [Rikenellaceae bacterium]
MTREIFIHRAIIAAAALIMLLMLFVIGRNMIHALSIRSDISTLEYEAEYYQKRIKSDSTLLEELKFDDKLEKYARENYRMQRRGERVYIIE